MATPYRNDERALRQRLSALDAQLRDVQALAEQQRALDEARARLEAERAEVAERLSSLGEAFSLEGLRIASPCQADWGAMAGDDRVRYCGQCQKNVYNLSGMKRDEAEALVQGAEGRVCVRMFRRADGSVLTSDCPEGVSRKRRRRLALVAGSGAMAAASAVAYGAFSVTMGAPPPIAMGAVAVAAPTTTTGLEVPTKVEAGETAKAQEGEIALMGAIDISDPKPAPRPKPLTGAGKAPSKPPASLKRGRQ